MQRLEDKPPFARFIVEAVEDRDASLKAGHWVGRDVIMIHLTPRGSKDIIEAIADDWLAMMALEVRQGRFEQSWLDQYKAAYKNFKDGVETTPDGFALKNWPAIRPAQLKVCQSLNIHTLEELVACNEEALAAVGMGGRALQTAARSYLDQAADPGKVAARQLTLEQENAQLKTQLAALAKKVDALTAEDEDA